MNEQAVATKNDWGDRGSAIYGETMGKRKKQKAPRWPNGRIDAHGLWDRDGDLWTISEEELDRKAAGSLIGDPTVPVVVSWCAGPLRWLDGGERQEVWRDEILPNFHDEPGWRPPPGAPGQLPFHAEAWQQGTRRLLLITDRD